jgi:peptide/nickel transport system substrate-binding protein
VITKRKFFTILSIIALLTAVLMILPCSVFAQRRGGELVYGTWQTPDNLDVQVSNLQVVVMIAWSYLDPLVRTRPDDPKYYPGLAESWTVSNDAKIFTFKLRQDVKFHDGTPLTAEAVKYSFDRIMDPQTKAQLARGALGPFERAEVVDRYTVRVHFSRPYGSFLRMAATVYVPIISPTAVKRYGDQYQFHVAGTGPFKLEEYVPKDHATLVRNTDYRWGPEWTHGGPAYLDKITYKFIPEDITRIGTLRTRETNLVDGIKSHQINRIEKNRRLKLEVSGTKGAPWILILNYQRWPTNIRLVRQAISFAVDREALVNLLYKGTNEPAYSPLEKGTLGYHPSVDKLSVYDPEKAKAILDRAGWKVGPDGIRVKDGKRLQVIEALWEEQQEPSTVIQSQLRKVGIELVLKSFDVGTAYPMWVTGDHNLVMPFFYWPDPQLLENWFAWDSIGGINWGQYINPKLEDLLAKAEMTADSQERAEIYQQAQRFLLIDAICVPLFGKSVVLGMRNEIEDITYSITGYPMFYQTYFSR